MVESGAPLVDAGAKDAGPACAALAGQPIRLHFIDALGRRAALQHGAVRRLLEARLAALRESLMDGQAPGGSGEATSPDAQPGAPASRSPLGGLLDRLAAHRGPVRGGDATASSATPSASDASPAVQTLAFMRQTWSHLKAERRWAESLADLPANPGPLHSQHVVHRALTRMRELSPDYFDRFVAHVDALLEVEQATRRDARAAGGSSAEGKRRAGTGRSQSEPHRHRLTARPVPSPDAHRSAPRPGSAARGRGP